MRSAIVGKIENYFYVTKPLVRRTKEGLRWNSDSIATVSSRTGLLSTYHDNNNKNNNDDNNNNNNDKCNNNK